MEQRKTFYPGQTDEQVTPQEAAARQLLSVQMLTVTCMSQVSVGTES